MEKESDYIVRGPKTIYGHLMDMVKRKCIIAAHFDRNQSFLTTIVMLDAKNNILALDCGPNEHLNKALLGSPKVLFRTEVEGVKASFTGKHIRQEKIDGHMAFVMPMPDSMFWLQRREFYRVKIPISHESSLCEIRFSTQFEDGEVEERVGQFRLLDISIRGFCFLNTQAEFVDILQMDTQISHCSIHLNDGSFDRVEFEVRYASEVKVSPTTSHYRVGCRFTHITHSFEHSIQRYIQSIELQKKLQENE